MIVVLVVVVIVVVVLIGLRVMMEAEEKARGESLW